MARKTTKKQTTGVVVQLPPPFVLNTISPITRNQNRVFKCYEEGKNLFLHGHAGVGKTFMALYLALRELQNSDQYKRVVIIRSIVPTRDIGALPGDIEEKTSIYEQPYQAICEELYSDPKAYNKLKGMKQIEFVSTSFLRGLTIRDAIVIVDEFQNQNYGELSTALTRLGSNTRVIFCGDTKQCDFSKESERKGHAAFEAVIARMNSFEVINFYPEDVVRSGIAREFLLAGG